jgi:hypothetical protein
MLPRHISVNLQLTGMNEQFYIIAHRMEQMETRFHPDLYILPDLQSHQLALILLVSLRRRRLACTPFRETHGIRVFCLTHQCRCFTTSKAQFIAVADLSKQSLLMALWNTDCFRIVLLFSGFFDSAAPLEMYQTIVKAPCRRDNPNTLV